MSKLTDEARTKHYRYAGKLAESKFCPTCLDPWPCLVERLRVRLEKLELAAEQAHEVACNERAGPGLRLHAWTALRAALEDES